MQETKIKAKKLMNRIFEKYNDVSAIYINHDNLEEKPSVMIKIHSSEAQPSKIWVDDLVDAKYMTVDIGEDTPVTISFMIFQSCSGPGNMQATTGTTVYLAENVLGTAPRDVEDGLDIFRKKLAGQCPSCGKSFDDLSSLKDHYRNSQDCIKRI